MAKPPKRPRDMNELAVHIGKIATHEIGDGETKSNSPASRRGKASVASLSARRRKEIAQTADSARRGTRKKKK